MPEDSFDFKQVSEEKDELDYEHLVECPHCKKPIAEDATLCYYCGEEVDLGKKSSWPVWLGLILIALLISYLIFL